MVDLLGGAVEGEPVADLHVRVRQHPDVEDIAHPEELFGFARANYEAGDLLGELDVPALKGDGWVACQGQSWWCRSVCSKARSGDRKSTRLNSSHLVISYAVFCLKK